MAQSMQKTARRRYRQQEGQVLTEAAKACGPRSRGRVPGTVKCRIGALREQGALFRGECSWAPGEPRDGSRQGGALADSSLTHLVRNAVRRSGCRRSTGPSSASERGG